MADAPLTAADIRWSSDPIARSEDIGIDGVLKPDDWGGLLHPAAAGDHSTYASPARIFGLLVLVQEELRSVRGLVHQTLALNAERDQELAASRQRVEAL